MVCCSKECHDIYLKNMNNKKKKRQVYVCDYCNKEFERTICSVNGKHHIFCSYECKNKANKIFYIGENAPRWNNSKTQEEREQERKYPEYYNWRRSVFERDNYTCQCCGDNKGNNLVAHHILNYSKNKELRTVITNGVTLCETCHTLFHKTFGYNDNNQVQLFDFINKFKNDNTEPSLRMA